jgi:tetratricopeptide (TPR) repeat protein
LTEWYGNGGIMYKGGYENDQMNGLWDWWHDNGVKSMERTFIKGSPTGNWFLWKEDGSIYENNSLSSASALFQISNCYRQIDKARYSIKLLNELLTKHQTDIIAPKAQYLIGDIYMNDLRDFKVAIHEYRKVIQNYSGSVQEPQAQFMIGYIFANIINDLESAKIEYDNFIKQYPTHELVPSVKFELEYLGKSIDEIPALKHIAN